MKINCEVLKALRENEGLSGNKLATKANVSQSHYWNVEAGRRDPSPAVTKKIAGALGVTVGALRLADADVAS